MSPTHSTSARFLPGSLRGAALFALMCAWGGVASLRAEGWSLTRIEGRDYVTASQIASFYSLGEGMRPAENRLSFIAEHGDLIMEIGTRDVQINGVRHWLGFAPFEHDGEIMISRIDLVKTIEPALRPQAITGLRSPMKIVLDAGHGGDDRGAVCPAGFEKDFNLDVCLVVADMLRAKGFEVVLTRDKDVFLSLEKRARIANAHPDAVLVSVHFNYSPHNPDANGFEVFALSPRGTPSTADDQLRVSHMRNEPGNASDPHNLALATSIQHAVLGNMPQFDRGVKRARFAVLKLAEIPAVLVEGAFLSHKGDRELAASPVWRRLLAEAVVAGIVDYRRLASSRTPPKLVADYRVAPASDLVLSANLKRLPADEPSVVHSQGN